MFDLKRPCVSCPFRKGQGSSFRLNPERLTRIIKADAFQCHKTVDYSRADEDDEEGNEIHGQGEHPQQCAGLMAVLVKEDKFNTIMQVASRLGAFDPDQLILEDAYDSIADVRKAHGGKEP